MAGILTTDLPRAVFGNCRVRFVCLCIDFLEWALLVGRRLSNVLVGEG